MGDVTALMMDVITEKSGHTITPLAVSVCLTPAAPSPLPLPYPVVGSSIEGIIDSPMRTKINGALIATVGSCIKTCHGNEPGTLKEVVSLNTTGPCFVIMGAPNVLIELGMTGITGSPCISNKAVTAGAGASASDAGGTGGAGGGGGEGSGSGGDGHGPGGPAGGGGASGSDAHTGASAGGSSGSPSGQQCQGGHPVDLVTGYVVDRATDLDIPGVLPLVWRRTYSSSRRADTTATLGPGWAHAFEQRLTEGEKVMVLREAEGREVYFAKIRPGESTFHRRERMTLHRDEEHRYRVVEHATRRTLELTAARPGGPALLAAIRDACGNALRLERDGERLVRVIDTAGREVSVVWKQGRISRLEVRTAGRLQQWVDYAYSGSGCLTAVTDALGGQEEYAYDRYHRMTSATLQSGVCFQYEYEPDSGRCRKTWGPKGLYAIEIRADVATKTTYVDGEEPRVITWNDDGLATREALPDGTVLEETAYDDDGFVVARVNGAGEGEQTWYDARGNRIRVVDASGAVTAWEYDDRDLPLQRVDADGKLTTFTHDDQGALTSVSHASGARFTLSYDALGRLLAVADERGPRRTLEYDAQHALIAETDGRGARTVYAHDDLARPVARTDALGRITRVSYDRLGRRLSVRFPDGATVQRTFDARGKVVREVDPSGNVFQLEYAGMGLLHRLVEPDGKAWSFAYTSTERLRRIENPLGEVYTFDRDDAGRVVEEKAFDGRVTQYGWSAAGHLERATYADRSWRAFAYDRAGRLIGETASDGSQLAFGRDRVGRVLHALLEENGQRTSTVFERDAFGRVVVERHGDRAVRSAYDAQGHRLERVMPDGAVTRFAHDVEGGLLAVEHAGHRLVFERDTLGREVSRGEAEGRYAIRSAYDARDRLIEQRASAPSPGEGIPAVLVQRQWRYDHGGRVARIDDARWGTTTYRHDRTGNLIEAHGSSVREAFEYDGADSLVRALAPLQGARGGSDGAWKLAPGNLLLQTKDVKYAYDARSRRIGARSLAGEAITEYAWDVRDRLREVKLPDGTRVTMTYDAFGRRVRKEVLATGLARPRTVDFVWDGSVIAADLDSERGARTFVHWPRTLEPLLQAEHGEVFAYVNDHLGTPRELLDAAGRVAWAAAISAWGKVVETRSDASRSRPVSSPFRLPGQYADDETGLSAALFRYFDPAVGRWMSPDPKGFAGGRNLQGFDGSPVFNTDPLGLASDPHKVHDVIDETNKGKGNITSAHTLTGEEALDAGAQHLGPGYREIGKPNSGVYRSADGLRQFRMDNNSLAGNHAPGVPHVHLETLDSNNNVVSNNHIPITR